VFRDGAEVEVEIVPSMLGSEDADFFICWAGIVLRRAPRCALERGGEAFAHMDGSVFAQATLGGSPADGREIMSQWFLLDIDGHPIKSLDDVVQVLESMKKEPQVSSQRDRRWVRIRFTDLDGREHIKALQSDNLFWPTLELRRGDSVRWKYIER
jgi:hypothetical protein